MTSSPRALPTGVPKLRPYHPPSLRSMGTIEVVTAGPDNGDMDQLIGGSGGFRKDGTS